VARKINNSVGVVVNYSGSTLSEELDNFARSLRIKEHFGSKEVERGDEVSSDSESEETCNYRFVKKSEL
jgi:hypothetical protein